MSDPVTSGPGLLIDEQIRPDSQVVRTYLTAEGDRLRIGLEVAGAPVGGGVLSTGAVLHVVRRYARALDDEVTAAIPGAPRLELPDGIALVCLHWRAVVDADGRDWLVLVAPGEEPQAALATGVAAALRYLVARLASEREGRAP